MTGWLLLLSAVLQVQQPVSAVSRLDHITHELQSASALARNGDLAAARNTVLQAYLNDYEVLESTYGSVLQNGETAFHQLLRSADARTFAINAVALDKEIVRVRQILPSAPVVAQAQVVGQHALVTPDNARTPEIRAVLSQLQTAAQAYQSGDHARALTLIEHAYLEGFEPIEPRLPRAVVDDVEKTIHLQLRPAIARNADAATVTSMLGAIGERLRTGDRFLAAGGSAWFAIINSFVIILREGLEAVLLIAALLAYLTATGAEAKHRRQIYLGVGLGVVATFITWFLASTLIPISGANRELLEGITALLAVGVLLYVANWLFQKTYIHDWKEYLRTRLNSAVTRGSAAAMAMLAFAAVYREGFETVLFYKALAFDAGIGAILAGFIPGFLLITLIGYGIIRAGVKLPLKKVFAGTNAVLMYLAFVFIGKGIYNLQEAGVFAPHPLPLPDHPALRQLLGFYPLVETVAAQLGFLALLTATYLWYRARARQSAPLPAPHGAAPPASLNNHRNQLAKPSADPLPRRARSRQ